MSERAVLIIDLYRLEILKQDSKLFSCLFNYLLTGLMITG
jgi:hypothetical protein